MAGSTVSLTGTYAKALNAVRTVLGNVKASGPNAIGTIQQDHTVPTTTTLAATTSLTTIKLPVVSTVDAPVLEKPKLPVVSIVDAPVLEKPKVPLVSTVDEPVLEKPKVPVEQKIRWHLGEPGATCSQTCAAKGFACEEKAFKAITSYVATTQAAAEASESCLSDATRPPVVEKTEERPVAVKTVTTGTGQPYNIYFREQSIGGWGGTCTCPDGQTYQVGDRHDNCRTMVCIGGTASSCSQSELPERKGRGVICGFKEVQDRYQYNSLVGSWGGTCTCPNGVVYVVGDNRDRCKTMACYGGVPSACEQNSNAKRVGMEVFCAPSTSSAPASPQFNLYRLRDKRAGAFGGLCTCPNGQSYIVGDLWELRGGCKQLACFGGTSGACESQNQEHRRFKSVQCAYVVEGKGNSVLLSGANTGKMENRCVCRNGETYLAGDHMDSCASTACYYGFYDPSACKRQFSHFDAGGKEVICNPLVDGMIVLPARADPKIIPKKREQVQSYDLYYREHAVGGWGGTCTCPSGETYQVGDQWDACASMACFGGTPGDCQRSRSPLRVHRGVVCGYSEAKDKYQYNQLVGSFGGTCTCPNGEIYNVGDFDNCGSLACFGGAASACDRTSILARAGMQAICGKSPTSAPAVMEFNMYSINSPAVGSMGGLCTCPNGQKYIVGDNRDSCGSLACSGGIQGICSRESKEWRRNRRVDCNYKDRQNKRIKVSGVGDSGGTCVCPDGQSLPAGWAGDSFGNCASGNLACVFGMPSACDHFVKADAPEGNLVVCSPFVDRKTGAPRPQKDLGIEAECRVTGDPHVLTFDSFLKRGRTWDPMRAPGHWWLVRSDGNEVSIQAKYGDCGHKITGGDRAGGWVHQAGLAPRACVIGVAVSGKFIGGKTLVIKAPCDWVFDAMRCTNNDREARISWDGQRVSNLAGTVLASWAGGRQVYVRVIGRQIDVELPDSVRFTILMVGDWTDHTTRGARWPYTYLDVFLRMRQGAAGRSQCGHCGKFDVNPLNYNMYEDTGVLKPTGSAAMDKFCNAVVSCEDRLLDGGADCKADVPATVVACPKTAKEKAVVACRAKIEKGEREVRVLDNLKAFVDQMVENCALDSCDDEEFLPEPEVIVNELEDLDGGFGQSPLICKLDTCAGSARGSCAYESEPTGTCEGRPPSLTWSRMCPCSQAIAPPRQGAITCAPGAIGCGEG